MVAGLNVAERDRPIPLARANRRSCDDAREDGAKDGKCTQETAAQADVIARISQTSPETAAQYINVEMKENL
jgi:hypothetical protein